MHTMKNKFEDFKPYFESLSTLQQAGFFLWPSLSSETITKSEKDYLQEVKPSGIIFFKRNLKSPEQAHHLISSLREIIEEKNSPFFKSLVTSIDEEGGRVSRLPIKNIRGKSPLEYADNHDKKGLEEQIKKQIYHAKKIGINCLLAPVCDILTEPKNEVMGDRCFGRDQETVSEYANIVHQTLAQENIWSCAKHFPGHGNTTTDSHKEFSLSDVSLDTLKKREWIPFIHLIKQNVPLIMAAHVLIPQIDKLNPATLSKQILTSQLKKELGFKGLILSDDLRMNAIALHYKTQKTQDSFIAEEDTSNKEHRASTEEDLYLKFACLDALNAGCDILLSCQSIEREMIIANSIAE